MSCWPTGVLPSAMLPVCVCVKGRGLRRGEVSTGEGMGAGSALSLLPGLLLKLLGEGPRLRPPGLLSLSLVSV